MSESSYPQNSNTATFNRWALLAVMLTIVIRTVTAVLMFDNLAADPDAYAHIAGNIRSASVYGRDMDFAQDKTPPDIRLTPTAYRPPLYSLALSCLVQEGELNRVAVAALHVVLAAITAYLVFLFAWHQGLGKLSFAAAMCVAIDPLLVMQSTLVMTETLATTCAVAAVVALARFHRVGSVPSAITAGLFVGAGIACRPVFLVWAVLISILLMRDVFRRRLRLVPAAVVPLTVLATILPWIVRNQAVIGKPVYATTHGGYTLLLANNESLFEHQRGKLLPDVWEPDDRFLQWNRAAMKTAMAEHAEPALRTDGVNDIANDGVNEFANDGQHWELRYDQLCAEKAKTDIRKHPVAFVKATLFRFIQLWNPLPNRTGPESRNRMLVRYGAGCWYVVVLALAAIALWRMRDKLLKNPWCWPALLVVAITAVHLVYWSNIRMRAPVMPFIYLFAVYAIGRFLASLRRTRKRRKRRTQPA